MASSLLKRVIGYRPWRPAAPRSVTSYYEEVLEQNRADIRGTQRDLYLCKKRREKLAARARVWGLCVYAVCVALVYARQPISPSFLHKALHYAPMIVVPAVMIGLQKAMERIYAWQARRHTSRLQDLEKQQTETVAKFREGVDFYKAQNLLREFEKPEDRNAYINAMKKKEADEKFQQRRAQVKQNEARERAQREVFDKQARMEIISLKKRSNLTKLTDFLLNDGPNNRYALICHKCHTHNGLVQECDLGIKYRCSVCSVINNDDGGGSGGGTAETRKIRSGKSATGSIQAKGAATSDSSSKSNSSTSTSSSTSSPKKSAKAKARANAKAKADHNKAWLDSRKGKAKQ